MTTVPEQMKGLVLESYAKKEDEEKKPYVYKEHLTVPSAEPHQLLIKVMVAGYW